MSEYAPFHMGNPQGDPIYSQNDLTLPFLQSTHNEAFSQPTTPQTTLSQTKYSSNEPAYVPQKRQKQAPAKPRTNQMTNEVAKELREVLKHHKAYAAPPTGTKWAWQQLFGMIQSNHLEQYVQAQYLDWICENISKKRSHAAAYSTSATAPSPSPSPYASTATTIITSMETNLAASTSSTSSITSLNENFIDTYSFDPNAPPEPLPFELGTVDVTNLNFENLQNFNTPSPVILSPQPPSPHPNTPVQIVVNTPASLQSPPTSLSLPGTPAQPMLSLPTSPVVLSTSPQPSLSIPHIGIPPSPQSLTTPPIPLSTSPQPFHTPTQPFSPPPHPSTSSLQPFSSPPPLSNSSLQPFSSPPPLSNSPLQPFSPPPTLSNSPLQPFSPPPTLSNSPLQPLSTLQQQHMEMTDLIENIPDGVFRNLQANEVKANLIQALDILKLSDARTKENIREISQADALEKVRNMIVYLYQYKKEHGGDGTEEYGFLAQQLQSLSPRLVKEQQSSGLLTIKTTDILALLAGSIRALADTNDTLLEKISRMNLACAPICVAYFEGDQLSVNPQALEVLRAVTESVSVIAVCGQQGDGNSTLCNNILQTKDKDRYFKTGSTQGIWMSYPVENQINLVVDSQGYDVGDKGVQVLTFLCSISNVMILCQKSNVSITLLEEKLKAVVQTYKKTKDEQTELPSLIVLTKDVLPGDVADSSKYSTCSEITSQFQPNTFMKLPKPSDESYSPALDSLRTCIAQYSRERKYARGAVLAQRINMCVYALRTGTKNVFEKVPLETSLPTPGGPTKPTPTKAKKWGAVQVPFTPTRTEVGAELSAPLPPPPPGKPGAKKLGTSTPYDNEPKKVWANVEGENNNNKTENVNSQEETSTLNDDVDGLDELDEFDDPNLDDGFNNNSNRIVYAGASSEKPDVGYTLRIKNSRLRNLYPAGVRMNGNSATSLGFDYYSQFNTVDARGWDEDEATWIRRTLNDPWDKLKDVSFKKCTLAPVDVISVLVDLPSFLPNTSGGGERFSVGRLAFLPRLKNQFVSAEISRIIVWLGTAPKNIDTIKRRYKCRGIVFSAKKGPLKDNKTYEVEWDSDVVVLWQDMDNISFLVPSYPEFLECRPTFLR